MVPIELERPTRDFTEAAAMSADEYLEAVDAGYRTVPDDCDLLAVGEMGIANTTAAATLCAALLGGGAARWAGRGTGVDDDGLARKCAAIETALHFHRGILGDPLAVAAALGGRELAAIAGAVLAARRHNVPVLLDGFVATSAVLPLARLDAGALDHCRAGHVSAESGHRDLLRELKLPPLLDLNMRLGEASGAGCRDPAGAGRPRLPRRDGNFHGGRRLRRGGLTKPCHISQRNWPGGQSLTKEPRMRMAVIKLIVVAAALFAAILPARAEIRILASPGGAVGPFLELFDRVRQSGERVVIDGPCLSACTLVLMTIPEERICVTRRAVLGFHAARSIDGRGRMYAEPEASRAVQEAYPAPVRDWISRRGGLTSRLLLLRGRELAAIYPRCR